MTLLVHTAGAQDRTPACVATADGTLVASNEVSARIAAILAGLTAHPGVTVADDAPAATAFECATLARILDRLHAAPYLNALRTGETAQVGPAIGPLARTFAATGTQPDTPIAPDTYARAEVAALASLRAAQKLADGTVKYAFALCRPPGHHAGRSFLGGYCFLNNAAVAALTLDDGGLGPVHMLDLDYHVGNGTSDVLSAHPDIGFTSLHAATNGAFPYVPDLAPALPAHRYISFSTPPAATDWLGALQSALDAAIDAGARSLVISLGFDIVAGDPHGGWSLAPSIFAEIGDRLAATGRPICLVQEGGYRIEALRDCANALVNGFMPPLAVKRKDLLMPQDHSPTDGLLPFRQAINELDDKLIDLLAQRLGICAAVAAYKRDHAIPMMQPDRVEAVKQRCAERAVSCGLDAVFTRDLYDRIIGEACSLELRIIEA